MAAIFFTTTFLSWSKLESSVVPTNIFAGTYRIQGLLYHPGLIAWVASKTKLATAVAP